MIIIKSIIDAVKYVKQPVETVFLGVWGLTLMDLFSYINISTFDNVDSNIKTAMAAVGAVYFLLTLPFKVLDLYHKYKNSKIDIQIRLEELEKLKKENDEATK